MAALDLGQNWLTGTLSSGLASLSSAANIGLAVYDNQISGTIPPSFTAFSWIAVAYNPLLYGVIPTGMVTSSQNMLQAWSSLNNGFYSYTWGSTVASSSALSNTNLQAPTYSTGFLFGTSIGLDRPLAAILLDLKAAMDPSGTVLTGWNSSTMQFCPPWQSYGSNPGQRTSSPGYGRWLVGLYKPSSYGASTGTSYCNDYGNTPTAPFVYTYASPPVVQALSNPMGSAVASTSTVPQTAALAGGISSLCLNAVGLKGTLPVQLRELRTTTAVLLSRNALTGALPSAWGASVAWNFSGSATKGFDSCVLLDLSQNRLNSTLPSALGYLGKNVGVALADNLFSGSVPATYTALSWVAVAYNPSLVGVLPAGLAAAGKLFAWSAYQCDFFSWTWASAAGGRQGFGYPPSRENNGYGTGWLYGTSIGLDRPLANILLDIRAAVDPTGAVLGSWNSSQLQPCRPFSRDGGSTFAQNAASPGYGQSWRYVSTTNVLNSAEYCQDLQAVGSTSSTSPTASVENTQLTGGLAGLWLFGLALRGTLPAVLQELRTASAVNLARNQLTGTIPTAWYVLC